MQNVDIALNDEIQEPEIPLVEVMDVEDNANFVEPEEVVVPRIINSNYIVNKFLYFFSKRDAILRIWQHHLYQISRLF